MHGEIIAIRDCVPRGNLHIDKRVFGRMLKEGTEPFWLPVGPPGPQPKVEMQFQVAVLVTFRNGVTALHILARLGNWVVLLIEAFTPEFETRKARRLWGLPRGGWIEQVQLPIRTRIYTTQRMPRES